MVIRVLKIAGVTTPKSIPRWFDNSGARAPCLLHDGIDFGCGRDVVTDRKFRGAWNAERNSRIVSETLARPDCEFQARLQIEEGHGPMLEFRANDAFCWQAKTIAIEIHRPFQVVNAEGNNRNARFHGMAPSLGEGQNVPDRLSDRVLTSRA
jgi:hypothetical protein